MRTQERCCTGVQLCQTAALNCPMLYHVMMSSLAKVHVRVCDDVFVVACMRMCACMRVFVGAFGVCVCT